MQNVSIKFYLFLIVMFSQQQTVFAKTKVVGYLPAYKGLLENVNTAQLMKLTHLNIAFINPDKSGNFFSGKQFTCTNTKYVQKLSKKELDEAIALAHQADVLVSFSIGGALMPPCAGNWRSLIQPESLDKTVDGLIQIVDDFNLDGLDFDIESKLLTGMIKDNNYLPFIQSLSKKLKKRNKILSAATGSYQGGMISTVSLPYFDYVSLMSYDAIGPTWGQAGVEHATIEQSRRDITLWLERGLKKEQLVLGLPLYGYGFGKYHANYSFALIMSEFRQSTKREDLIGNACAGCDYITYNGPITIAAKTNLALKKGSGVMVWELTQDTKDSSSLLHIINESLLQRTAN
jgi:chitinase